MRVLNIIGAPGIAGAEQVVFDLTVALLQTGHEVRILCSPRLAPFYARTSAGITPLLHKGPGHLIGAMALNTMASFYDVIHLHGLSAALIDTLTLPSPFAKTVMTLHGAEGVVLTEAPHGLKEKIMRICVQSAASRAEEIVAVSTSLAKEFSHYGHKVSIVRNGVNVDRVRSEAAQYHCSAKLVDGLRKAGAMCLIFPGRLSRSLKGQDVAIRTLAELIRRGANVYLFLAGSGKDFDYLQTLARNLGVQGWVRFLGHLPHEQMVAYLERSDIVLTHLVTQGLSQGLSQVHLEAGGTGQTNGHCVQRGHVYVEGLSVLP